MRLLAALFVVTAALALSLPPGALAQVQTLVFDSAPITIGPYGVARDVQLAPSPKVDGYVVAMKASLVDVLGNPVPHTDVMLHHVVFAKLGAPDATCSSVVGYDGRRSPIQTQRFYAEGEEHYSMSLPDGYGYPNRATDTWGLLYMLMNHHDRASTVQIRYTVTYAVGESRTSVEPIWLDVRNCRADPIFNVPGTGGARSTYSQHASQHDVTLATGPVGFASPDLTHGSFSFRFTRPGTYRLFCSLHPSRMTQVIRVR